MWVAKTCLLFVEKREVQEETKQGEKKQRKVKLLTGCQSFCLGGRNFVDLASLVDEAPLDHLEV